MKNLKMSILLVGLLISGICLGSQKMLQSVPPVNINGGPICPYSQLTINFSNLPCMTKEARYIINCDIRNPGYSKVNPAIIQISNDKNNGVMAIDGSHIRTGQVKLNKLVRKFSVFDVLVRRTNDCSADNVQYTFRNLDNTDTVYLENCVATLDAD